LLLTRLEPGRGDHLVGELRRPAREQQGGLYRSQAVAGGGGQGGGRVRLPVGGALVPDQPRHRGQLGGREQRRVRGLLLQREVGDGAEGAGRIVVEGEPVHTLGLVVGPLAAEDDDG